MDNELTIKQSWWQLTSIQVGGAVCLPMLMIGQELGKTYGLSHAIIAIIVGNALLFGIGFIKAMMSYRTKETTIQNACRYFGSAGTKLLGIIMLMSLVGWFALQLTVISLSVQKSIGLFLGLTPSISLLNIVIGTIITVVALFGIQALAFLSDISMPLLIVILLYAVYQAYANGNVLPSLMQHSYQGISFVMAASIMAVIDIPTYYRFARSKKASVISIAVFFMLALPLIELAGVYVGTRNSGSLIDALTGTGGVLWQLAVVIFLILAGWTTNNTNLYSATVVFEHLIPKSSAIVRTCVLGLLGTALSCVDLLNAYESVLNGMGIFISSMGGVIVLQYLTQHMFNITKQSLVSMSAWLLGVMVGLLSIMGTITMTHIALLDAFITAAITVLLSNMIIKGFSWK